MLIVLFAAVTQLVRADTIPVSAGAQDAAWAADGRLALGIRGDIWVRRAGSDANPGWVRVTEGPAWDRQPVWSADGATLVFTSTASGQPQLWRVRVGATGAAGPPERVTTSREPESDPALAPDGSIVFARGRGPQARLWIRRPDGGERRLTKRDAGAERWPSWSPDGSRVAYSAVSEGRTRLRLHYVAGDSGKVIVDDRDAEHATWAPRGDRLAFATRTARAGVWVTTPDARYVNFVSARRAAPAWSPDGRTIALVELPPADV